MTQNIDRNLADKKHERTTHVLPHLGFSGISVKKKIYVRQEIVFSEIPNAAKRENVSGNCTGTVLTIKPTDKN